MAAAEQVVTDELPERSLREELEAAVEEVSAKEEAPPEPKVARDEGGKFAAKQQQEAHESSKQPSYNEPKVQPISEKVVAPSTPTPPAEPSFVGAPSSWSNQAKSKWAGIDPEIKAEIAKREADIARGMSKVDEERAFAKEVQRSVAPYEAHIRAAGASIPQVIQSVLNTAYILQTADPVTKAREIAKVISANRIDLSLVSQPQSDPQVAALHQRIAQLEGQTQQQTQLQQQAEEQQVMNAIQAFEADPKNKYFSSVKADMGQLIGSGYTGTLQEAYEAAIWARPDIRAMQLADQAAAEKAKQDQAIKAQRARTKGLSVRGGPGGSPAPVVNPNSSVREDLEAAFNDARGRI